MAKGTNYVSKEADAQGYFHYTEEENQIWADLVKRQKQVLSGLVSKAYLHGLDVLKLPEDRVPQLKDVSKVLKKETSFEVTAVPALISPQRFFELLANRQFPAATFIRTREEFDYLQEPDIFHEIWGHCPMLTNKTYTDFMQKYGQMALQLDKKYIWMMQRLFWFTVEFGLINEGEGPKIYGAGIASSAGESTYAIQSFKPQRCPFNILDVFRTPYRIDIYQTVYYVINDFNELYNVVSHSLVPYMDKALEQGMFKPTYPPKNEAL